MGPPWSGSGARRDLARRVGWGALLVLAVPLQSAVMGSVAIGGIVPDAPLLCLLLFAVFNGPTAGFAAGAALGLAIDLFSAGVTVFYAVVYAALGVGAALVGRVTANLHPAVLIAVVAAASLLLGMSQALWFGPFDRAEDMVHWMISGLVPQTLYDTTLGGALYGVWFFRHRPTRHTFKDHDDFFASGRFSGPVR
jgi:rod shape-determining protein MreD